MENIRDNFEIIGMESISDNVSHKIFVNNARSDFYSEPKQESVDSTSNDLSHADNSAESEFVEVFEEKELKELKEKKSVYIKPNIKMATGNHKREGDAVEAREVNILVGVPKDDKVIAKVVARVKEIQVGITNDGKKVPGADVLKSSGTVVNGKKIKITQKMIEDAYLKLRTVIEDRKVDAESVTIIVAYALQIANEMLSTSKTYKVELALAIIRKLIEEEVEDIDQRMMLHMLVETTLPSLINTIQGLPGLLSKLFAKCKCCYVPKNE